MNFGSLLGALSSVLPNYVQGQRMANQDNWNDLKNYNNVQAGQYANAFNAATWQPRLNMFHNQATNSMFNTWANMLNTAAHTAWFPYNVMQGQMFSANAWPLAQVQVGGIASAWNNPLFAQAMMGNRQQQNPFMMGGAQPPSALNFGG